MSPIRLSPNAPCPCGSSRRYSQCCQLLHKGGSAPSPEALMRSRYCAYVLALVDYIMQTTHPEGTSYQADTAAWRRSIQQFCQHTRFERLQILGAGGDMVTFRAILWSGKQDVSFTEVSVFRQHEGRWKYYSGTVLDH